MAGSISIAICSVGCTHIYIIYREMNATRSSAVEPSAGNGTIFIRAYHLYRHERRGCVALPYWCVWPQNHHVLHPYSDWCRPEPRAIISSYIPILGYMQLFTSKSTKEMMQSLLIYKVTPVTPRRCCCWAFVLCAASCPVLLCMCVEDLDVCCVLLETVETARPFTHWYTSLCRARPWRCLCVCAVYTAGLVI